MDITNKKRGRYVAGLIFALFMMLVGIWTSIKLWEFLSNQELPAFTVVLIIGVYLIVFGNLGIKAVEKTLKFSIKNNQEHITYSHSVEIDKNPYTLDILRKNKILREYLQGVYLEQDIYNKLWLHYEDDGIFNLLKNAPNRVDHLWLLVDSTSDAANRAIYLSHKERCRPPYIALDTKGNFWTVTE